MDGHLLWWKLVVRSMTTVQANEIMQELWRRLNSVRYDLLVQLGGDADFVGILRDILEKHQPQGERK